MSEPGFTPIPDEHLPPGLRASHPDVIALAEALARAHVKRDIAASREDSEHAHGHLRPV